MEMAERGGGPRALAPTVAKLLRPALARRGFAALSIVERWGDIVGPLLAARTMPERIAFPPGKREDGTLHLRVDGGALALELQHAEALILERINGHFGYRAVTRLRLIQRPMPERLRLPRANPVPDAPADPLLTDRLAVIADDDLRAALARLGQAVRTRDAGQAAKKA